MFDNQEMSVFWWKENTCRDQLEDGELPPGMVAARFLPWLVFVFFLCFWQSLRSVSRRPLVVFLDKLCIAQHDPALKAKGIRGLSTFLDRSDELTILWSSRYFTRCLDESGILKS